MQFYLVGLGNPGEEYEYTRHNVGRLALSFVCEKYGLGNFEKDKRVQALLAHGNIDSQNVLCVMPDAYMNNSGKSIVKILESKKDSHHMIIFYDDIDLPIGDVKISFNKGSGGHKGVESIISSLGTKEFVRIRIGISPKNIFGKMKKPRGEKNVTTHVMGRFNKREQVILDSVFEKTAHAIEVILQEGKEKAMNMFN